MEASMRPILTGFFDHDQTSMQAQIDFAVKHQIEEISLRRVNDYPLSKIDQKTYQDIINVYKKNKIKISLIDPNLSAYDLYDEKKHKEALEIYKEMMLLAQKTKTPYVLLRLPKFNNVIEEIEALKHVLEDYLHLAQLHHRKLILEPSDGHKANTYAYVFKKFKTPLLRICFDPVYFTIQKESSTTVYRLLKKSIVFLRANDIDFKGVPKLIGHGKTDFLKISKKLLRDKFDGFIMVDNQLHELIVEPDHDEKKSFFKKIFIKKDKKADKAYEELKSQLKWQDAEKNVTYDDIIENQIRLIRYIFK
jgi:sugar phosphate isomerase/epimerase